MSFATLARNRNTERLIALISALAVLLSMMVVFADAAKAYDGTVTWDCDGWIIDLNDYEQGADITITVDGVEVDSEIGWQNFDSSGTWDDTQAHTLDIIVDASDDTDQPVYAFTSNGSFSPAGESGEFSFTLDIDLAACNPPQVQTIVISPAVGCSISWGGDHFDMRAMIDFTLTPAEGVESITLTPVVGGHASITGATWTGDPVAVQAWDYDWVANMEDGYTGEPPSGHIDLDNDFYAQCTCPTGTIDLNDTGALFANDPSQDSLPGEPASPVDIPAGFYHLYLASLDNHSSHPDQVQDNEIWALADAEDGLGSFESPPTDDLPNNLDFQSYHVTDTTGPVFVPEFDGATLWTVHAAAPSTRIESIAPLCARFEPLTQDVDVQVAATSCLVDSQGQPVGDIGITIDPDAQATVSVYSDPARTNLVGSVSATGDIQGLAPGTYYWEAEPAQGFTLTGASQGEVTITDCEVTIEIGGLCVLDGDTGSGEISIEISVSNGATVVVTDSSDQIVDTLTESGTVAVTEGESYTWEATAADGFTITGDSSGEIDIEQCTPEVEPGEIIVEKVVEDGAGGGFEFTFDTVDFTLADNTLAHGESSSSGPLTPGVGYGVSEVVPAGWSLVSAVCDDGSDPTNIDLAVGEVVTCTFVNEVVDEVAASILVTVGGDCEVVGDDGVGEITVTMSVAGGADVVVRDADGDVVDSFDSDGSVEVPEGEVYSWEATANAGFEFPPGFDSTGSVTIETCSNPEVLPFTGIDADVLAIVSTVLLGAGVLAVVSTRRREEL